MKKLLTCLAFLAILLASCGNHADTSKKAQVNKADVEKARRAERAKRAERARQPLKDTANWEEPPRCNCPPTIYLQPLNGFSRKQAEEVRQKLITYNPCIFLSDCVEILPTIHLGKSKLNDAKTRYRADKILNGCLKDANWHTRYVCLLDEDISTSYKDRPDWGVLGLSYKGRYVSVCSTYRLKRKQDLWKLVVHEYVHAAYDYDHCPKDDPRCIMKDAKGHPRFDKESDLCAYCKSQLRI